MILALVYWKTIHIILHVILHVWFPSYVMFILPFLNLIAHTKDAVVEEFYNGLISPAGVMRYEYDPAFGNPVEHCLSKCF